MLTIRAYSKKQYRGGFIRVSMRLNASNAGFLAGDSTRAVQVPSEGGHYNPWVQGQTGRVSPLKIMLPCRRFADGARTTRVLSPPCLGVSSNTMPSPTGQDQEFQCVQEASCLRRNLSAGAKGEGLQREVPLLSSCTGAVSFYSVLEWCNAQREVMLHRWMPILFLLRDGSMQ